MKEDRSENIPNDEITLKEIILKGHAFYREVWNYWKLVVLIPIPFIVYMLYQAITTPVEYPATLTFMVNEDQGGGAGGFSAILGIVGLGGAGGGKYNLDKILELARSRKIMQQVLLERREIDGIDDFMGNHIIRVYNLHEEWEEDTTGLATFAFKQTNITAFSPLENKVLKALHGKIIGGKDVAGLISTSFGKESGIMRMRVKTESEFLTIALAEVAYDKLSSFYIIKSTEKQQKTFDIVEAKADSIKQLMNSTEYTLANFKDTNRGLLSAKDKLREQQLLRDVSGYSLLYGETLKNLEIADFSLRSSTPFVQLIDAPIAPIEPEGKSKILAIILGGIIGGMLAVGYIVIRKIIRDTMGEDELETS